MPFRKKSHANTVPSGDPALLDLWYMKNGGDKMNNRQRRLVQFKQFFGGFHCY
ncbi:unnamed protein product [Spirodela intermedia]|uniref:Uncharacterized protein n=1 Tax=Spirodela intermedia TaxID=51605 RepID=A0A7I8JJY5_SPIIN|nr:unnamed protein product [Spirodela intermedia]CAA6670171.1 unnamed protein product [Spirodela intermedia]